MATVVVTPPRRSRSSAASVAPDAAFLSLGQTGNGATANIIDRGDSTGPVLLQITTQIGATPTCTYAIEGSADGSTWFSVAYADSATPTTVSVATFAITTATTVWKIVQPNVPVRFLRVTYSANTNVTNTIQAFPFNAA